MVKPVARRLVAAHLRNAFGVSERRAARVVRLHRSTCRYPARPDRSAELRKRLQTLAVNCPRIGYRMMLDRIRYEGTLVNHKRVYRVYSEEGLQLPKRRRKRLRSVGRQPLPAASGLNVRWSADFVSDALGQGRRFRILNVLDDCSREDLASSVDYSIPGYRVRTVLESIAAKRGYPQVLVVDNGPEFRSREVDAWACQHAVRIHFIDPGKPMQNAFVESFNDKMRAECLNVNWFTDLEDAQVRIEAWRREYNELRPHSSIGRIPPAEFARRVADLWSPPAPDGPQHAQFSAARNEESVMLTLDQ